MATSDREIGCVTVLGSERGGKYPHGHSLLVRGRDATAIIDPSLAIIGRTDLPRVDLVLNSHGHEDHVAGNHLFPEASWHMPEGDLPCIVSLDGLMTAYGLSAEADVAFRQTLLERFHYTPRPDARPLQDGQTIELGGGVRVRVIHAPGHTRGHSVLHVEPADVLYLGDIDLSSFGPYYGDAWSSLPDFEQTLAHVLTLHARHYATFHHIGVLDERDAFLERLDRFTAVIATREQRLLDFLKEPHTLDEVVAHRFVYRPGEGDVFANDVERRTAEQHIARWVESGQVQRVADDRYVAR